MDKNINIQDFDYPLPEEKIAKFPLENRAQSKLLVYKNGKIKDAVFKEISQYLKPNTQLVFNNTKVVQARILFTKEHNSRPIEIFCLEPFNSDVERAMSTTQQIEYTCLVGRAKKWKDEILSIPLAKTALKAEKVAQENGTYRIKFSWNTNQSFSEILELVGHMPLPPYFKRPDQESDKKRYQTVYAKNDGSVAAPTAGLHFNKEVLKNLKDNGHEILYATLHVGAGTFKPVQTNNVAEHEMHFEEVHLTSKFIKKLKAHTQGRTAIGTTSVRTLESLYWLGVKQIQQKNIDLLEQWEAYDLPQDILVEDALNAILETLNGQDLFFKTQLMIVPGYTFKMVNSIVTNFHQPKSTLLLLVAAATKGKWQNVYHHAMQNRYRFLSYGDSSIIHI